MEKIVTTRKDHECDYCGKTIPKHNKAYYMAFRAPAYNEEGNQIGIKYFNIYFCFDTNKDSVPACAAPDDFDIE